ncbi:MAG: TatD family hydrolase [Spirochaetaceae bacterium]
MGRSKDPFEDMLILPATTDSHFHAEVCSERGLDIDALLRRASASGLAHALDISIAPRTFEKRRSLLADLPVALLAVGAHPSEAGTLEPSELSELLRAQASFPEVVALGEIGLDWYWDFGTRHAQRNLFEAQLSVADEVGLPVIIHNRDATEDVAAVLADRRPDRGGIMHCFSDGPTEAKRFLDMGMHIGFGGNVTYKKSQAIREAARMVPEDRLLAETDAPFLAPQAVRGRPNHPGYLGHTISFLAELRGTTPEHLAATTTKNFEALFGLTPYGEE